MTEQQIEKIMYLDCRTEENKAKLQKFLHNIPQFKKCKGDVQIELLEKMIATITGKYAVTMQWLTFLNDQGKNIPYWSSSIKEDVAHKYVTTITSVGIYEHLAKVSIFLYAMLKGWTKGGLVTREELEISKLKEKEKYDKD